MITQIALAVLAVLLAVGGLWACYICIKINEEDKREQDAKVRVCD